MNDTFDQIYNLTVNLIMMWKVLLLLVFVFVLSVANYFRNRKFWRNVFLTGAGFTLIGLGGDIVDGPSTLDELHRWSWMRHLGVAVLLTGALGMHWDKFRVYLFRDSSLFHGLEGEKTMAEQPPLDPPDEDDQSGGQPPPPPTPPD